ncbi:WD40-repeat-containing domain protein [Syncephalastrum racemosum]|uniref:WD40-repeat-containing domain protein n=1 Tax=Syncephalastrum racemosum TaxID=13706 RepID=A0A1X2H5K8_SYNRA|nr:WD40-repeat-containing domain protein [Syncephalastrum racemosum]
MESNASRRSYPYPYNAVNPAQQQQQQQQPQTQTQAHASQRQQHGKEIYQYDAPWPVYSMDWSKNPADQKGFRLALGSLIEESNNKFQIVARTDMLDGGSMYHSSNQQNQPDFTVVTEADMFYPITKILWEPWKGDSRRPDLLATSGDILRLWELVDHPRYGSTSNSINSSSGRTSPQYHMQQLVKKSELANTKQTDFCAPLTSFDWNETDPSLVVTSSIDTTCTVWNVETNQAKTQLIAHDSDVYDVAFMHGSPDIFASVGADGSVRLFDLRSLEHSTILYEAPPQQQNGSQANTSNPLLRLQFNRNNPNLIATFHMESTSVLILDIRYPSSPMAELVKGHQGCVNSVNWSPTHATQISTGGDDGQVLVWDINHPGSAGSNDNHSSRQYSQRYSQHASPRLVQDPILAYSGVAAVNSLSWSRAVPEWISVSFGTTVQALRV